MADNFWADEAHVEKLKELWDEGLSAGQIRLQFGCEVTRNAILGKVMRLGLPTRANSISTTGRVQRHRSASRPKPVSIKEPPPPVVEEEPVILADGRHVTILTITDRMCRWPIGDPASSDFHFCGRSPKSGAPYCEAHARRAYQPAQTAASRRKADAVDTAKQDAQMRRVGL